MVKICVLGAGVVGLSTAVNIQNLLPNASVSILAEKFDIETTSDGSAGIFRPTTTHTPGQPTEIYRRWCKQGFKHYSDLALSSESAASGISVAHGYMFSNALEDLSLRDYIFSFHELTPDEVKKLKVPYKYGYLLATCLIECRKYQPWLTKKFKERGGTIRPRKINNLSELVGEFDIVVNCTGFGSRKLLNDVGVYPVRGQVLRVEAPWMKHFIATDDTVYMYPTTDTVVIGGTRQKDNFDTEIDPNDSERILHRAKTVWPAIEKSKIKWTWVGLRPHRIPVRVENEKMTFPKGTLQVVHNYGHGANGVALSWGSSLDAATLVKETAKKLEFSSKL